MIDEQPSRGSAAALDPAAPAQPSAPHAHTHPTTGEGQAEGEGAQASSMTFTQRALAWVREFIQFGLVGATAFVIDMGLFNLFQHGPLGFLSGHVNTANALAASIATI